MPTVGPGFAVMTSYGYGPGFHVPLPSECASPNVKRPPRTPTSQYPPSSGVGARPTMSVPVLGAGTEPWAARVAEREDLTASRHEPVPATVVGRRDAGDVRLHVAGGEAAEIRGVAGSGDEPRSARRPEAVRSGHRGRGDDPTPWT